MLKSPGYINSLRRMGDCELCGAMKVGTKRVSYHKSHIEACSRCCEKMNLVPLRSKTSVRNQTITKKAGVSRTKSLNLKSLIDNFSKKITTKRTEKNWTKAELAKKANVRLIDIQNIESGKILEDKVVNKIEKALDLNLFTDETTPDVRRVRTTGGSGMTLGDYLNENN